MRLWDRDTGALLRLLESGRASSALADDISNQSESSEARDCASTTEPAAAAIERERLQALATRLGGRVCFPRPEFCTDNGAMIAFAGALRLQAGLHEPEAVTVLPRWDMASLPPLPPGSTTHAYKD